jgi:hypothetical protein
MDARSAENRSESAGPHVQIRIPANLQVIPSKPTGGLEPPTPIIASASHVSPSHPERAFIGHLAGAKRHRGREGTTRETPNGRPPTGRMAEATASRGPRARTWAQRLECGPPDRGSSRPRRMAREPSREGRSEGNGVRSCPRYQGVRRRRVAAPSVRASSVEPAMTAMTAMSSAPRAPRVPRMVARCRASKA